jgi:hypothetical protein
MTFFVRKRQDVSGRAPRTRQGDAFVSQSVLMCHRLPQVSCGWHPDRFQFVGGLLEQVLIVHQSPHTSRDNSTQATLEEVHGPLHGINMEVPEISHPVVATLVEVGLHCSPQIS